MTERSGYITGDKGDVIRMTYFADNRPEGITSYWKAPKGQVFVAIIIGVEDKKHQHNLPELGKMLRALGWIPGPELAKAKPDL